MAELLFEILSEEIPARMQKRAADDLKRLVTEGLKAAGLDFSSANAFVTPRRLALVIDGLPLAQEDVSEERRGPNVQAPEKAQEGFKKSLPEGARIEERETPKGTFFFAIIEKKGGQTRSVLSAILNDVLLKMPWPKSMRWSNTVFRWVRPIHGIVCIFDGQVINFSYGFGDREGDGSKSIFLNFGDSTKGHRFLAPDAFTVTDFADYKQKLFDAKVVLDAAERRAEILKRARALAEEAGLSLNEDEGLADEVAGLVEWPVPLMGTIEPEFMDLPEEVLIDTIKTHQKYFVCRKADGSLADKYIVISNMETTDGGKAVVAGNGRVLRARLQDAKFYWDTDRAITLEDRARKLGDIVFHAKLGTVAEKVARMRELASFFAKDTGADPKEADRAALLCKADLTAGVVYEFPDLQGIMGRYYAMNDEEPQSVADAIAEHYSPLGPSDDCPTKPVSVAVALADKIDTLTGFWAIDEKPTGSKDPFALRRAALGVIRLITENGLRVALSDVFEKSHMLHDKQLVEQLGAAMGPSTRVSATDRYTVEQEVNPSRIISQPVIAMCDAVPDLLSFFADRLKVYLKDKGVRHDAIDAVFALGGEDDLVRLLARVDALTAFLGSDDGANLLTAYKRAANILRAEEKKDGCAYDGAPDPSLLADDAERKLFGVLGLTMATIGTAVEGEDFEKAMGLLAQLRGPVDTFFEDVTVNADDPAVRENRLKLLNLIRKALSGVADFSKIEG